MRALLAAALLFVVVLPLEALPTADTVFLRFDWPVGMKAQIQADWSRVQVTGQQRDSSHFRSTYRMQVSAHPAGRLISIDSFEVRPLTVTRNGDSRTLRPYFMEHVKWIDIVMPASGSEPGAQSTRVDIRSSRYRY